MNTKKNAVKSNTRDYILEQAVSLFASHGYSGVSMRDLSSAVGISSAAFYHHFPDKDSLYLEVMNYAFANKAAGIVSALEVDSDPLVRLESFINSFTILMSSDPDFRVLVQRELLDDDETRLELVAKEVFSGPFQAVSSLAEELSPGCDPHMLAVSMVGLVLFHLEITTIRRFLPGGRDQHNSPESIAKHVTQLLVNALFSNQDKSQDKEIKPLEKMT